jgi:peptidyl-prolyl cis-trans isomerase D
VAKELGKAADRTSLGAVVKDDLPAEFAGAIFDLPSGGVSKPVKSGFGWHVFKVTEIQPGSVEPFDQVQDRLRDELKREKAADQVPQLANRLEDTLAAGGALDEVAQKVDLPLRKVAAVDQRGRGPDGKPVPDLPPGNQLLGTAFGLGNNATSQLIDAGNDSYLAVHVDEVTASVLPPLAEIKDQVSSAWTAAQRDSAAKQRADALAEKIRAGTEFAKAGAEAGTAVKATAPFGRDGTGAELPNTVVTQLFGGPIGTVAVGAGPDGYIVARLTKIEPVDPATADAQLTKLTSELHQALGNDLLQQFESGLRERFRVRINQTAVEQGL